MDLFNWTIMELLVEQSLRDRYSDSQRPQPVRRSGLKGALAASLVRVGLRLDPTAGERLRALPHSPVAPEVRQQA